MPNRPTEQLVDIVDGSETVIERRTRSEAHAEGLLHRTVISELINSKGEWTLVKQARDRQDPGQYVSPMGGHVDAGETNEQALKREVWEELGITDFKFRFVGRAVYRRRVRDRDENHYFILYESYSDSEPALNEEAVDYKKFTHDELKKSLRDVPDQFGEAFLFVVRTFYPEMLSE